MNLWLQRWRATSLKTRCSLLFALVAALVVSLAGSYLYSALWQEMYRRSDLQVTGRVDYYRHLLGKNFTLPVLTSNTGLFENMLGNEQDVLLFSLPGQKPLISVNPAHILLPPLMPVAENTPLQVSGVQGGVTADGVPMRAIAAQVRLNDGQLLQIVAAHVMLNEQRMLEHYLWRVVGAVVAAFILIAALGYLVLRRGLSPLWRMAAQASAIAPNTLSTRVSDADAPQEVRQLIRAFNAMLDRLNEGYQRLTQFSADLAHEIRTPIGALMGHCQVALYQPRSVEEYETLLSDNIAELERLSRMVENILFLARASHEQPVLNRAPVGVEAELRRVADYFDMLADERGIELRYEGHATLSVDALLFQRALSNLVANAVRYANADSPVTLSASSSPEGVVIAVTNLGPLLPPEQLTRLFDRFYRVDATRSASSDSSGLGLSIVRAIMTLHGGEVIARCDPVNQTTGRICFSLIFPAVDRIA
ncbi:heavy metal sensor histidine kinase [Dickeya dianthicola]|uniref:heavy metal sensor histidine kinase n=1 Tax=Dickeya dianthicola TaxID=204039 RepID=UPI001865CBDD|nr:heavy metal sensor histidine kinase [Dickeya dianthicola]QOL12954.1 heavy metal sensor histidine kinase [Dickeya dianthicola]